MQKVITFLPRALAIYFIIRQIRRYCKYGFHIFWQTPPIDNHPYFNSNFYIGYNIGYVVGSNAGLISLIIILGIVAYRKFYAKQSA
jgi:hypothetical protein